MANAKDVAAVIQSALDEIGVSGQLEVSMDGQEVTSSVGSPRGDNLYVGVVVEDRSEKAKQSLPD